MSSRRDVFVAFVEHLRCVSPSVMVLLLSGGPPVAPMYTAYAVTPEQTGGYSLEHWATRVVECASEWRAWGLVGVMPERALAMLPRGLERVAVRTDAAPYEGRFGGRAWAK